MIKVLKNLIIVMFSIITIYVLVAGSFSIVKNMGEQETAVAQTEQNTILPQIAQGSIEDVTIPDIITEDVELDSVEDVNNFNENETKNIEVDKFLYNQLSDDEKYIYNAFVKNKEEMKTGTAVVELGDYFTNMLKSKNGDTTELRTCYQTAVEAYTYDNPDVFYLEPTKMFLTVSTTRFSDGNTEFNVNISNGNADNYLIEEFNSKEEVDSALNEIEKVKNYIAQHRSDNIKNVHDFLINTIDYDESISQENIYNVYGALVNKLCVCEGYAKAYKYLLEEATGVQCIIVVGTGINDKGQTERHAWNYVLCDNEWYAVDTTWDDPIVRGGGKATNEDKTRYFMKKGRDFNNTHKMETRFTDEGKDFQFPDIG